MTANEHRVSFWSDKSVLELMVMGCTTFSILKATARFKEEMSNSLKVV